MDEDDDKRPNDAEQAEADYSFEGYRIAFNRRVVLVPPPAAAPDKR